MNEQRGDVRGKWTAPGAGAHYAEARFGSRRAAERDPRIVAALLGAHGVRGPLLDAPCGTGRLHATLARFALPLCGVDVSPPMLAQARSNGSTRLARASVEHLPFADGAFDVVVSCRFLHHLRERDELERALRELVRVSRRLIVASVWDAASLPALRVRLGLKRGEGPRGRCAVRRATVEELLASAGARVVAWKHSLRFVSQQAFFVAERR